jgi:NAD(P)-dependent dehydrogenase (short-subunit alcohol dehydrogenase family)
VTAAPVAIVTGSTSGIGLGVAARLADDGYRVVVNGRQQPKVDAAVQQLAGPARTLAGVAADVTDEVQVARLVDQTTARFGRLDLLVNNAGQPNVAPAEDMTAAAWRATIDIDLTAPFLCAQAAARVMLSQGSGVIINISSIFGRTGNAGRAAYVAAKHGLDGLTKALASEWSPRGIRVCGVNPAYVQTPLVDAAMAAGGFGAAELSRRTPLGRLGTSDEVAALVAFLASPAAAYITGESVAVDGGWLAYGGW